MSTLARLALLSALVAPALPAQDAAAPDFSEWSCRFCAFEESASAWLEPSLGYVSDRSFHFGNYTGLEDAGLLPDLSGAVRQRGADGTAWDMHLQDMGRDARQVGLRGGRQGLYRVSLGHESLPRLLAADSRSPFTGTTLVLPPGWVRAGSTGGMTALDASLRESWLRQERERTLLGVEFVPHRSADLRFDYSRDEIRGTGATGASFLTLASELPRPISQTLDRASLSVAARHALGQAQLSLASSFFANDVEALIWQNPYSGPASGATLGQMAQAPDNRAYRLGLGLGSAPGLPLQVSAQLATGRMTQDQRFLPATVNPDEAVALPRGSLDGRVDTTLASVRAAWAMRPGLRASADYLHDERDNRTPVAAWTQVVMDSFTGDVRRNAPYSSRRERWRASLEQRVPGGLRLAAGIEDETRERRLHDTAQTQELRYWGRLAWRPVDAGHLRLRLGHAERDGGELAGDPAAAPQNPLLRAYHTADRERDEARGDLSLSLPGVSTTFNASYARDRYPGTAVGRTAASEFGYGADVALHPVGGVSAGLFLSRRLQDTEQAGSQAFGAPDWFADQEDATSVVGLRARWEGPRGLELGADYAYSRSEGSIVMAAGAGATAFPLLVTRWQDARLTARYPLRPDLALRLDLVHERYDARDWALDGVAPDTVPNLLALGQGGGSADVAAVVLGLRWEFRGVQAD
jgi:MtrB/PioB family decaheme-associated outer membrane protein